MIYALYTVHVVVCFFLILVVLLQQGKGADLSVFGGGGTMTAFGARGAATLLHKMTVASFVGFILTTLAIGILQSRDSGASVMRGIETISEEVEASEPAAAPPDVTGGEVPLTGALPEADEPAAIASPESVGEDGVSATAGEEGSSPDPGGS